MKKGTFYAPVAQPVEQYPFKVLVKGSNPFRGTKVADFQFFDRKKLKNWKSAFFDFL